VPMSQDNIFDKIQELLGSLQGNYNILEEQIDIDVQMEYFESSKGIKNSFDTADTPEYLEDLFSGAKSVSEKKVLLSRLATVGQVEAYRAIEKYLSDPDPELKDWATLAMQESRMLLESSFLDENQVFISTGMGGKGNKLRYFVVFLAKGDKTLTAFNQKIFATEASYILKKCNSEIEVIQFSKKYATLKTIIPIEVQLYEIFEDIVAECNQFGDFLEMNFIVTNVKELTFEEIDDVILKSKKTDIESGLDS